MRLIAIFVALALAMTLAACGGSDEESTTEPPVTEQGAEAGQEAGSSDQRPEPKPPTTPGSEPVPGAKAAAPGVPVSRGGDNSIQLWGVEGTDEQRVQAAEGLRAFLDARADGSRAEICEQLSTKLLTDLREQLASALGANPTCPELLQVAMRRGDPEVLRAEAEIKPLSFRVDEEDQGFLIYRDTEGRVWAFPMNPDQGEWKVSLLGPTPLN